MNLAHQTMLLQGSRIARNFFCTKLFPQGFHSTSVFLRLCKSFKKDPFSRQNERFSEGYFKVTLALTSGARSDRSRSSQQTRGKEEEGSQK